MRSSFWSAPPRPLKAGNSKHCASRLSSNLEPTGERHSRESTRPYTHALLSLRWGRSEWLLHRGESSTAQRIWRGIFSDRRRLHLSCPQKAKPEVSRPMDSLPATARKLRSVERWQAPGRSSSEKSPAPSSAISDSSDTCPCGAALRAGCGICFAAFGHSVCCYYSWSGCLQQMFRGWACRRMATQSFTGRL